MSAFVLLAREAGQSASGPEMTVELAAYSTKRLAPSYSEKRTG